MEKEDQSQPLDLLHLLSLPNLQELRRRFATMIEGEPSAYREKRVIDILSEFSLLEPRNQAEWMDATLAQRKETLFRVLEILAVIDGAVKGMSHVESAERKPEIIKRMIEDMLRTADSENKFYNFGAKDKMLAALNALSPRVHQAILGFAAKLAYRRTDASFPVLVLCEDGQNYLLTERVPSPVQPSVDAMTAKSLLGEWGLSLPTDEQWGFLNGLNLINRREDRSGSCAVVTREHTSSPSMFSNYTRVANASSSHVLGDSPDNTLVGFRALRVISKD